MTLDQRGLDVALQVSPGEVLAVLGANGAGKSTLLSLIAGLVRPDAGRITLDGDVLVDTDRHVWTSPHRRGVVLLAQQALLFPHLTAAANVEFGPRSKGSSRTEAKATAAKWLAAVDATGFADRRPGQLSGGQAQRVAIARALVPRPEVLLLDEPFSALDAFTRVSLQDHLLDLWTDSRPTLILVTHDVDEAIVLADRIMVMRPQPGRIFEEIVADLPRPRDRQSAAFDFVKRRVLVALDRSLDRPKSVDDTETRVDTGAALWW